MAIEFEFDPFEEADTDRPRRVQRSKIEEAAELIKVEMLSYIGEGKSPLSGGLWKRGLSKAYKDRKGEESSSGFANLELSGDLLDSLTVEAIPGGKIRISIPDDQADKAEGNLIGSYGREANDAKAREFMPAPDLGIDKPFKRPILQKLKALLEDE